MKVCALIVLVDELLAPRASIEFPTDQVNCIRSHFTGEYTYRKMKHSLEEKWFGDTYLKIGKIIFCYRPTYLLALKIEMVYMKCLMIYLLHSNILATLPEYGFFTILATYEHFCTFDSTNPA